MKAIRKTIKTLFVIWTSCAFAYANQGIEKPLNQEYEQTIACSLNKKTIDIKQFDFKEMNSLTVHQLTVPIFWFDFFKWGYVTRKNKERVFEIVTIEG